jgi:LysR family cys regulon transcriptional activator
MIGCRRGTFLRGFMYDFMGLFAPHLNRELIDQAFEAKTRQDERHLFDDIVLPVL